MTSSSRAAWLTYLPTHSDEVPASALYRNQGDLGIGRRLLEMAENLDHDGRAEWANRARCEMQRRIAEEDPLEDHSDARGPYLMIEVLRSTGLFPMTDIELSDYLMVRDTYIAWRREQAQTKHDDWLRRPFWRRTKSNEPSKDYQP